MPLNNLYRGNNTTQIGASTFDINTELSIKEGYEIGPTFYNVDIGKAYIDQITHQRGEKRNIVAVSASSALKKLRSTIPDQNYSYAGVFTFFDTFNTGNFTDRWQQSGSNWSQGNMQITGASNNNTEMIGYYDKADFRNAFLEMRVSPQAEAGQVFIGSRQTSFSSQSGSSGVQGYYVQFEPGTNAYKIITRTPSGSTDFFTTSFTITAGNDYWVRLINYEEKTYGYFSADGLSWNWIGNTWLVNDIHKRGIIGAANTGVAIDVKEFKVMTYDPAYTLKTLVEDIGYKAGLNVYVPPIYTHSFGSLGGGLTVLGGSFTVTGGELTARGTSTANQWATYSTGQSFKDFRFDVEMLAGRSTVAGIFVGNSGNDFNGFWYTGSTLTTGISRLMTIGSAHEILVPDGATTARFTNYFPIVTGYPYGVSYYKLSIIKNQDELSFLIDDQQIFYYKGTSGFNPNGYNSIGMMVLPLAGASNIALFKNLKVYPLSETVESFQIYAGSNLENAMERLADIGEFKYLMSGNTFRVIPELSQNNASNRTYNIGSTHGAWDIYTENTNNVITNVIIYGKKGIYGEAWNKELQKKIGSQRTYTVNDETITTIEQAKQLAQKTLRNLNKNKFSMSYENKAQVDVEKFDVLTVIDENTGVSQNLRVYNTNKNYTPAAADFTQTFTLGEV